MKGIIYEDIHAKKRKRKTRMVRNRCRRKNLTGNKLEDKMYYNHSGYPGGLRERSAKVMIEKYPEEMVERAVKGMLPHNSLGRAMGKKLFVYAGSDHKHEAQKPTALNID